VWEYCAKSELHPAAAGLEVLKGRQKGVRARETKRSLGTNALPPLQGGSLCANLFPGVKTPG
jgi:hypothetical protein